MTKSGKAWLEMNKCDASLIFSASKGMRHKHNFIADCQKIFLGFGQAQKKEMSQMQAYLIKQIIRGLFFDFSLLMEAVAGPAVGQRQIKQQILEVG